MSWANKVLPVFMATASESTRKTAHMPDTVQIDTTFSRLKSRSSSWFQEFEERFNRTLLELNAWRRNLANLKDWSEILADYDQNDAWALRNHFVEPMVYFCMLQPSSTRDRLAQVATNGIHQANLCTQAGYKDVLDQDRLMPGKFLGRPRTERQLARLAKHWAGADRLLAALQSLDSESYRQQTFDYRNRASHFIAPRLELGEVQFVTRSIVPATRMVQQPDGSYRQKEIDGKKVVAYDLGGIRPLTLNEIIETNSCE
ncbi:MAG: hypothetical protein IPN98_08815 [Propionivibrio sp.]|nr:hypothetical protein [Propionivibrio sp.]